MNKTENSYIFYLILPFILFMLLGTLEPAPKSTAAAGGEIAAPADGAAETPADGAAETLADGAAETPADETAPAKAETAESEPLSLSNFSSHPLGYPAVYLLKILAVSVSVVFCWSVWKELFPLRWTWWTTGAIFGGLAGTALWVGLSEIPFSLVGGGRAAFNPFENCPSENLAWGFFAVRFFGLALLVPLIEEVFLRGFVLRFIEGENWLSVPVGAYTFKAAAAAAVYGALTHPELIAAVVWFLLVTWYVSRSKNIWDAVVFHVSTNAGLGIYVLCSGAWHLL